MVNAVFAKMDAYQKQGNSESLDLMKLYGGSNPSGNPSALKPSSGRNILAGGPGGIALEESKEKNFNADTMTDANTH